MNLLNNKLASVRIQLKAYNKAMENSNDEQIKKDLQHKIDLLQEEEDFLLKELKVMD